jgi:hypothetical protein
LGLAPEYQKEYQNMLKTRDVQVKYCWLKYSFAALVAFPVLASGPVVFRVSDPIQPGETALLFGDSIGAGVVAEGWRVPESGAAPPAQRLQVLQASDISAKIVIPADWKPGLFAVRLRGASAPVYLNRTEAWWFLAGEAQEVHPGEQVRVFGKNLGTATASWLTSGSHRLPLKRIDGDPYAARFSVPATTAPGEYELRVSNGWGGAAGQSEPLRVVVKPCVPWPNQKFNVKFFGAAGDGVRDDTPAFLAALANAESEGGGIVFIPGGRYKITGKLMVPPHTVVRGEKREAVWLFVPRETPQLPSVFVGNRDFAIEELSLVSQSALHLVIAPDVPAMNTLPWGGDPPKGVEASNVRLHRLRLQHLLFGHRVGKSYARRNIDVGYATISLSGEDLELSDSEVISSGMPIATHGSRRLRIERNRLDTGRSGWYGIWNSVETVVEGNIIEGRDLEAGYGGMQGRSDRLYYAGNRLQDGYGCEREALTFDTPYAARWMGRIGETASNTFTTKEYTGEEKRWTPRELAGEICLIAYGKGVGQYVQIRDNTESTITLERPWDVLPDATSNMVIRSGRSQIVITRNHFTDASAAVQLYAQSYGIILDRNQAERTGGMYGLSWDFWWEVKKMRRYSTCMFNQWLNNDLGEGFIYQQGAWGDGVLGPAGDPRSGKLDPPAITVLGNVVRNNRLSDHNTLGALLTGKHPFSMTEFGTAGYFGRDTIIEGNTVVNSPVGIDVYPGYRDTVVRNNKVEKCAVPFSDDGVDTWVAPGARERFQRQAVKDRFGVTPQGPLWEAVAKAANGPVDPDVAAMLVGLHGERKGNVLRLRAEPWAPALSASAAGKTVELKPDVVAELPDAEEVELVLHGCKVRVRTTSF